MNLPNFNFQLGSSGVVGWIFVILWLIYMLWYAVILWEILRRPDWAVELRILWFLVITMAPLIGLIFHFFIVPSAPDETFAEPGHPSPKPAGSDDLAPQ